MAPRSSALRRLRPGSDDANDAADHLSHPSSPHGPEARKRRRLEPTPDSGSDTSPRPASADDGPTAGTQDPDPDGSPIRSNGSPHGIPNGIADGIVNGHAAPNTFRPGAIVRVSVENFVTYEKADFFPGPNLNMVIGPNGTGKSSLVCAICLGLGYSPRHLGRAASVREFVKHGKDVATIEIELQKRPKDRANHLVRVQIRREQGTQKWWLNGKETTHKSVQSLMQALNIQVDNLCQFLPQDRVVEFAACTPVDLLHETLRAAAGSEMLQWQEQLQQLHKEKKGLAATVDGDSQILNNLEARQQGLQADVDRIREREEIQERVKNLQSALVLTQYEAAREKHLQARDRKKEAERLLRQLQLEAGPSLEAVNQKQEYRGQIDAAMPAIRKALQNSIQASQEAGRLVAAAAEEVGEMSSKLEAEHNGFDAKKRELAASRSKIRSFQADMKSQPPAFNASEWNQKIRAEEHHMRELEAEQRQVGVDLEAVREKGKAVVAEAKRIQSDLESLATQQGQQLNFMKRHFPEIATGWEWVQQHQDQFEKEVFGPPMISCSIKDERYTDHVQSLLQTDDFLCFTAQTKADFKRLTDQLYRASSLGLDGFAVDFLNGPDPVLAMLCAEKRIHQAGVSLRDHDDAEFEKLISDGRVNQWAAGKFTYTVRRRREYGPQAMTTISKNIRPGRFWTSQPVDDQEKAELERRLSEAEGERGVLKEENDRLRKQRLQIAERQEDINRKIEDLKAQKSALQREYQKWQSLPAKIEAEERAKAAHEEAMRDARQNMLDIQLDWDKAALERARLALRYEESLEQVKQSRLSLLEAKIWLIEARSDVEGLKRRNLSLLEKLEQEKSKVREAVEEANQAKAEGKRLSEQVRQVLARDGDKRELLTQLSQGKSPREVEVEMAAEEAKLELIQAANPNVMRDFERRAQEMAQLRKKMDGLKAGLERIQGQLSELMAKFEPRLEELVSRINEAFAYNFEQINCAGEVRVHKEDDFDQWALEIMVKFRESERLQRLDAHRQSGGERAVSTIFYLMALQSMARSPFRVVDEINQGMDPRNERMVHERMVDIACGPDTSQYFLITPKLLTGLRYDAKMRVLCIASGEHMPVHGTKLDFARCLALQRALLAAS